MIFESDRRLIRFYLFTVLPQVGSSARGSTYFWRPHSMPLSPHDRNNFETLSAAFRNGDVLLMECQDVATSKTVPVICAVNPHADGSRTLVPFARMFDDNPYLLINPPHPDRAGFATQEEIWLGSIL